MILKLFKFSLCFIASFLILTLPIGDQTLFSWAHQTIAPYKNPALSVLKETLKFSFDKSKEAFINTTPHNKDIQKTNHQIDQVNKIDSSTQKPDEFQETYTEQEKDFLLKVLKGDHD